MKQNYRLPTGGRIDRQDSLTFTFNGDTLHGFAGDTIASALLANGVNVVARSFKYHRPRGIATAGPEEPNAIFTIGDGGRHTPNVRATLAELADGMKVRSQNGWPSVNWDLGAAFSAAGRLLPAGFYYKTFMWPPKLWMSYEKIIRHFAASAKVPQEIDADTYVHHHVHCDVLIVGGGPAGISAALAAGASGAQVIVADMNPELGGDLLNDGGEEQIEGQPTAAWLRDSAQILRDSANVTVLTRTTVQGYYDYNALIAVESFPPANYSNLRQRLWKIRAKQVIIATGAIERPLVFAGNDLPGVMTANAVRAYINRFGVLPGGRILFFTNNDSAYAAALVAANVGARVEIVDIRSDVDGYWQRRVHHQGITVRLGYGICGVRRTGGLLATQLVALSPGADILQMGADFLSHAYDVIAVSGGWTPTVHLFSQARGTLAWNKGCGAFAPHKAHPLNSCRICGAANAIFSLSTCLRVGSEAGVAAAADVGFSAAVRTPTAVAAPVECASLFVPFIPTVHPLGRGPGKHFVDWMNDVTAADILLAAREGYDSVEHMKRYTAAGFGTDQGKTSNINALCLLAHARGQTPEAVGHTTFRPLYTPVPFGTIAGADRRELFAPVRRTPLHDWHVAHGAVFEDVGEWKRPCYFSHSGETMAAATARECRAARNDVAIMDASTLGKIDIQGPDAAAFLDRIYTNNIATLKNGRCRYSMMLREDGMIFDDGVVMRLGDNHFHITTSTGHAASVMNWLEEWLQTEWTHLRVFCTSVTEQWTVIALVGPKARELLSSVTDLSLTDFPFMAVRQGTVAEVPARVCRISFSGELAYEINVPARYGLHVWETLITHGKAQITPYGTETMRMLRAEKGYIIVGQDCDSAITATDMGLAWMLSQKDFVGKRSLTRAAMTKPHRLQFVGLLTEDSNMVLPEGVYLAADADARPPFKSEGYVTSSYMSATLGRSIALGMIAGGRARYGETLYAALLDGRRIAVKITDTVFWDKEGKRRDG